MNIGRIEQDGFVSEYEYADSSNNDQRIFYPVTGHLIQLKDEPSAMFLYDDFAKLFHPIANVSFLHRILNPVEGIKSYPRPFIVEKTDAEKKIDGYKYGSKIVSIGDKLKISYIGGSIYKPLVEGSIEQFGSFANTKSLLYMPEEWEKRKSRLENDNYIFEFTDDAAGELTLKLTAKKKDDEKKTTGGTGNITIELTGTEGNGKITVNTTGIIAVNQLDVEANPLQTVLLDNTKDHCKLQITQGEQKQTILMDETIGLKLKAAKGAEEFMANGDTLVADLKELIEAIEALVWMTNQGPTVGLNPASKQKLESLKGKLDKILAQ